MNPIIVDQSIWHQGSNPETEVAIQRALQQISSGVDNDA
jgi:hypothetical protein